jgi:PAS domain S-box-containing protein
MKVFRTLYIDLLFIIVVCVLLRLAFVSYKRINQLSANADIVIGTNVINLKLEQTTSDLTDAETAERGYLLTGNTGFLQPVDSAIKATYKTFAEIDSSSKSELQKKNIKALKTLIDNKVDHIRIAVNRKDSLLTDPKKLESFLLQGKENMDSIKNQITTMTGVENTFLIEGSKEKGRIGMVTPFSSLVLSFFSLSIVFVAYYKIRNDVKNKKRDLDEIMLLTKKTKELNEELRIQNEIFNQAEETALQGTFSVDLNTGQLTCSGNLYTLFGCEPREFIPALDKFEKYIHPDDKEYIKKAAAEIVKDKVGKSWKYSIIAKDGKLKHVKSTGKIIKSGDKELLVGTIQDATQETLLSQQIKFREAQLTQAQIIGKMGAFYSDYLTNKITWSDELYRLYGYEPGEIDIDKASVANVYKEDLPTIKDAIKNSQEKGTPLDIEYRRIDKTGRLRYVYSKGEVDRDSGGNIIGLFGINMDITSLREKELQLKESERLNRTILDLAPNIVYIYDIEKSENVFVNKSIFHTTGYDEREVAGLGNELMNEFVHPEDRERVSAHHEHCRHLRDNEISEIEYRFKNKKGDYIHLFSRDTAFKRNEQGEVTQIIGIAINITEIKNVNEALILSNRKLERTNQDLMSFTFVASHDLQEPLRKIKTFITGIMEREEQGFLESTLRNFSRISESATRMQELINALLVYSQLNDSYIVHEKLDLNDAILEVKNMLQHIIEEKRAVIECSELPTITGVRTQFVQVFCNIIENALKYSKPNVNPHITILAEKAEADEIEKAGHDSNISYWKISIADNGIGFDQQYGNKIFEIFQRLHVKTQYTGTGIGLSICKKIVENYKGFISATGKQNIGSVFNIFLPLNDPQ